MTDVAHEVATLLRACAQESGLRETFAGPAHMLLRRRLAEDDAFATEARARLAAIPDAVLPRDHASRWLKATLSKALESP